MFQPRRELARYEAHLVGATINISVQTIAEMRLGALNKNWGAQSIGTLEAFLASLMLVDYKSRLGYRRAQIMHEARSLGRRLEAGDAWVAATALLLNALLLTRDKDFSTESCPSIAVVR